MEKSKELFLQESLEFWQSRTKRKLTLEDAREIAENTGVVFEILLSASQRQSSLTAERSAVS